MPSTHALYNLIQMYIIILATHPLLYNLRYISGFTALRIIYTKFCTRDKLSLYIEILLSEKAGRIGRERKSVNFTIAIN